MIIEDKREAKTEERWALVTGASSGIGYEIAKFLDLQGYKLVLVARREERLHELQQFLKNENHILRADLREYGEVLHVFTYCETFGITLDLLINNAGFGYKGEFVDEPLDTVQNMIRVNITALVTLTRLFLPKMIQCGQGCIVQIASLASFFSGPYMANYFATKNYVLSFSRALAFELRVSPVHVLTLCPGPVKTEFGQVAGAGAGSRCFLKKIIKTPDQIAKIMWKAIQKKKTVVVCGGIFSILLVLRYILPQSLIFKLTGFFNRSKK